VRTRGHQGAVALIGAWPPTAPGHESSSAGVENGEAAGRRRRSGGGEGAHRGPRLSVERGSGERWWVRWRTMGVLPFIGVGGGRGGNRREW
jgi:hypothetical protein